jgi:phosphoribosyl 1,2-cyclic phosphodiesterase
MINSSLYICPLSSGSRGNCLHISTEQNALLIDVGLSGVEIERRLATKGFYPQDLTAIVITHEHSDHVKGAGILSRRFNIPVYINKDTYQACSNIGKIEKLEFFECGKSFNIDTIKINPFSISHDAKDPVGLTLEYEGKKLGIATDLGIVTTLVKEHLKECSLLYIESNHDPEMLINGPYPWHLKQRIKSRTGHLSNPDTRDLLAELKYRNNNLKHVILAHLSEENNTPEKALKTVQQGLNGSDICLKVAMPDKPGGVIKL